MVTGHVFSCCPSPRAWSFSCPFPIGGRLGWGHARVNAELQTGNWQRSPHPRLPPKAGRSKTSPFSPRHFSKTPCPISSTLPPKAHAACNCWSSGACAASCCCPTIRRMPSRWKRCSLAKRLRPTCKGSPRSSWWRRWIGCTAVACRPRRCCAPTQPWRWGGAFWASPKTRLRRVPCWATSRVVNTAC